MTTNAVVRNALERAGQTVTKNELDEVEHNSLLKRLELIKQEVKDCIFALHGGIHSSLNNLDAWADVGLAYDDKARRKFAGLSKAVQKCLKLRAEIEVELKHVDSINESLRSEYSGARR